MGRFVDSVGRRAGSLLYTVLYSLSALSTTSQSLATLFLGRLAGGLGTSLLFSAPEAWLVGEFDKLSSSGKQYLSQTFGWAYAGDSVVAILAGQLASFVAQRYGPTGPFTISLSFLVSAAVLMLLKWKENVASGKAENITTSSTSTSPQESDGVDNVSTTSSSSGPSIKEALNIMLQDKRILLLGAVQALFEGAMYIFVLQWPPAMKNAITAFYSSSTSASSPIVPFGNIFSCFMACCLLGSTIFSSVQKHKLLTNERLAFYMLSIASIALRLPLYNAFTSLPILTLGFFLFEVCVGIYFPIIGTLRSSYIPDSHRGVMMNLFGIPLNLIVVTVFMNINKLGNKGALYIASNALLIAAVCMFRLMNLKKLEDTGKEVV
jgi:MFS transporter, MFS domain-containing protein family, molybdate-anion transporter